MDLSFLPQIMACKDTSVRRQLLDSSTRKILRGYYVQDVKENWGLGNTHSFSSINFHKIYIFWKSVFTHWILCIN